MKNPDTKFFIFAILALVVVIILYTYLPISEANIKGDMIGMTFMTGGPLAGYVVLLIVYAKTAGKFTKDDLNSSLYLEKKEKTAGNWNVVSTSLEAKITFQGNLSFKLEKGKLTLSGILNDENKVNAIQVSSQVCEFSDSGELLLIYKMHDPTHDDKLSMGFSTLTQTGENEMRGNWSAFGNGDSVKSGTITYRKLG